MVFADLFDPQGRRQQSWWSTGLTILCRGRVRPENLLAGCRVPAPASWPATAPASVAGRRAATAPTGSRLPPFAQAL
ncbi:hypothetical protein GCM10009678_14750 [Actinomadura kijaniata]